MKKNIFVLFAFLSVFVFSENKTTKQKIHHIQSQNLAQQNISRAIALFDNAVKCYFVGEDMALSRFYNPFTKVRSDEKGSVWMYTSSIEAVNAILHALKLQKENGNEQLYNQHYNRYVQLLHKLYQNLAYYAGTYTLTSYTQTKEWTVYGVDRSSSQGKARVEGIYNVYDDQQWLVRELLEAYKLTGNNEYLVQAEYLTEYILDGWDCTLDANGNEYGGITWGPGYVSKHACSNGPMVSPLVWLYELYKDKNDQLTYRYIGSDKKREMKTVKKSEYYIRFAKAIYHWQKDHLLRSDEVFDDFMGGCEPNCKVSYEFLNDKIYRKHTELRSKIGPAYSYNSGSMLSGAADLYHVTNNPLYLDDVKKLTRASFEYFAKKDKNVKGYYTYNVSGFSNWFNGVLMRSYFDAYPFCNDATEALGSFQMNLDYGYKNFLTEGFLPDNLLVGWESNGDSNNIEAMFTFSFIAEYAILARYEMQKTK